MKLRYKIFLMFAALSAIPLIIMTYFAYQRYQETIDMQVSTYAETLFDNALNETNSSIDDIERTISYLTLFSSEGKYSLSEWLRPFTSENGGYTSYDIQQTYRYCNSVFGNLLLSDSRINGIYIFTPSGVLFSSCSSSEWNMDNKYDYTVSEWYHTTLSLNGKFYISSLEDHDMFLSNNPSVFLSKSMTDIYNHELLGVIMVDCSPEIFDLNNLNAMPETVELSIYNQETGNILYTNATEGTNLNDPRSISMESELSLPVLKLKAVYDYSGLHKDYDLTGTLLIIVAVLFLTIFLILGWFASANLVKPIEELSRTMSSQNADYFEFTSPYMNRTDEIGTLYNEYAEMLKTLEKSIQNEYQHKLISLDSQMKYLEAYINTHFLFNTLESINSMAELNDNEPIAVMSLALGNMFRYSIKTESEVVTVADELNHVNDYVSIQLIRFSNKFKLELDIPEELYNQHILKIVLQPLVENAIIHGLDSCSKGDTVTVSGRKEGDVLCIDVSDNGQGMEDAALSELRESLNHTASFTELGHRTKQSIGLKNIHSRIELYYGKGYGLSIASEKEKGTTVTVRVPVIM
ncbi:MAG: histidine kinase [Lachnospiraceae bacterium]|nr:histidine kinase [Lachnospiraceae bacterium]